VLDSVWKPPPGLTLYEEPDENADPSNNQNVTYGHFNPTQTQPQPLSDAARILNVDSGTLADGSRKTTFMGRFGDEESEEKMTRVIRKRRLDYAEAAIKTHSLTDKDGKELAEVSQVSIVFLYTGLHSLYRSWRLGKCFWSSWLA
jgi:hypothetical protein